MRSSFEADTVLCAELDLPLLGALDCHGLVDTVSDEFSFMVF